VALVAWLALFAGAILIYAGFTGQSIVDELRTILAGDKRAKAKS
jgi:hypothetical protein